MIWRAGRGWEEGSIYCREQPVVLAILSLCSAHKGAKIKLGAENRGAKSESEGARADKRVLHVGGQEGLCQGTGLVDKLRSGQKPWRTG